jgi:hypothetical protein
MADVPERASYNKLLVAVLAFDEPDGAAGE